MPVIDSNITEFTPSANPDFNSTASMSHQVSRGTLRGVSDKVWIKKEMEDPSTARFEALAQEFFRLLIPHQPETRVVCDNVNNVYYILSEEVPGYRELPRNEQQKFTNGNYSGLGHAMLASMFLQEVDLKNGNIGLDDKNRVIKIDGDWCFASHKSKDPYRNYDITPQTINELPYPIASAFNWLDLKREDALFRSSNLIDPAILSSAPQFRSDVNETILKICLLPDSFIEQFIDAYIPSGGEYFIDLIKERRDQLQSSATLSASFLNYLNSEDASIAKKNILNEMKIFKSGGTRLISNAAFKSLKAEVNSQATALLPTPIIVNASQFQKQITQLGFYTFYQKMGLAKQPDITLDAVINLMNKAGNDKKSVSAAKIIIDHYALEAIDGINTDFVNILAKIDKITKDIKIVTARPSSRRACDKGSPEMMTFLATLELLEESKELRKAKSKIIELITDVNLPTISVAHKINTLRIILPKAAAITEQLATIKKEIDHIIKGNAPLRSVDNMTARFKSTIESIKALNKAPTWDIRQDSDSDSDSSPEPTKH